MSDALTMEFRLHTLRRREAFLERHAATCLRQIWQSDLHSELGYSHRRDFAREEFGLSLKACQESVRLDRCLESLPHTESAFVSGEVSKSKVQAMLPVLESTNERVWLRRAVGRTVAGLEKLVWAESKQRAVKAPKTNGASTGARSDAIDTEKNLVLRQATPLRARLVWEAARDEVSKRVGTRLTEADALSLYLAEFWSGVAPEVRSRIQPTGHWPPKFCTDLRRTAPSADTAAFTYIEPDVESTGFGDANTDLSTFAGCLRAGVPPSQTDGQSFVTEPAMAWDAFKTEEREAIEARWLASRRGKIRLARQALQTSDAPATRTRRERSPREWLELYHRLETLRRRVRVEQGAHLNEIKKSCAYRLLGFSEFAHYVTERLGLGRKSADERVALSKLLSRRPKLRKSFEEGRISQSHLLWLRRLIGAGVRSFQEVHAWARIAESATVKTYETMVRDAMKQVAIRKDHKDTLASPELILPPTPREWAVIQSESLRRPDDTLTESGRRRISALAAGGPDAESAESSVDPERLAEELVSDPDERMDQTTHVRAPKDVIESYQRAIALLRAVYGHDKPAWWCREVLVLHVRRHWAREDVITNRQVKRSEVYYRDGFVCSVPTCTETRDLMSHHVEFLSRSGPDTLENQATVCTACHLHGIHGDGAIEVEGLAPTGLQWKLGERRYDAGGFRVASAQPSSLVFGARL